MTLENQLTLEQQLAEKRDAALTRSPQAFKILERDNFKLLAEGLRERALHEGQIASNFSLPNAIGKIVTLSELVAQGPVVLTFYRGEWCPYCNLTLRAYQNVLPQIKELGASLIAIAPQTPDHSLSMAQKNELEFEVLSDVGSQVIRQYGLVFTVSEEIKQSYQSRGLDLAGYNGVDSWELPVPGTFVIGPDGSVKLAFVEPDYTRRLGPEKILETLREME